MADYTPSNPGAMFSGSKLSIVVPSDSTNLVGVRGLWVGGAGVINVLAQSDTVPVQLTVPAGTLLPIFAARVYATSTTATLIVALC